MTNPTDILLPCMTLVGWTLCVLLVMPYRRIKAALARQVTADDFKYGESANVPPAVRIPNRNFMNLLEVPVLFYVVGLVAYVTQHVDATAVALAWSYVALRVLHSLIHLSYNHVIHRLAVFAASNLVLAVLWGRVLVDLAR
ncbi:MAPEG family protein [Dokdonella sp.]|uniref:MAPEG family protein n=1 Tax=Dokdonella sp. TaxID=2291710 RepID=UPI001B2A6F00|nr:MAPEG family protein [Dokdonella sp.]MBO9663211.1 MAPEG family protein [Dokdonella sp.]